MDFQFPPANIDNRLPEVFRNTTNSYKYFWFLSLVEMMRDTRDYKISIQDVAIKMIGKAWYPILQFRLSFGSQDKLAHIVTQFGEITELPPASSPILVQETIAANIHLPVIAKLVRDLVRYVPYRFIRPWFSGQLKGISDAQINARISELAHTGFADKTSAPIYRFSGENLFLNHNWIDYVRKNLRVLQDFGLINLLGYLQNRNPHVPNILAKLTPPLTRNLTKPREYWRKFIAAHPTFTCIYTQQPLGQISYDLDHFLPWSYTGHDQIWNLVPVVPAANQSKSDQLPKWEPYFRQFGQAQKQFFDFHLGSPISSAPRWMEAYSIGFRSSLSEISSLDTQQFIQKLANILQPQLEIAQNMGFPAGWEFGRNHT